MDTKTWYEYNVTVLVEKFPYILMLILVTLIINELLGYKAATYVLGVLLISMLLVNANKLFPVEV